MIITVLIVVWATIGLIFGLALYADKTMPHSDKKKNNLTVLMLGPAWWIIRGLAAVYIELRLWLVGPEESDGKDPPGQIGPFP